MSVEGGAEGVPEQGGGTRGEEIGAGLVVEVVEVELRPLRLEQECWGRMVKLVVATKVSIGDRSGGRSQEGRLGRGLVRAPLSASRGDAACFSALGRRRSLKDLETGRPECSFPVSL